MLFFYLGSTEKKDVSSSESSLKSNAADVLNIIQDGHLTSPEWQLTLDELVNQATRDEFYYDQVTEFFLS